MPQVPLTEVRRDPRTFANRQLTTIEEAQIINYLKAIGFSLGMLLNFGAPSLQHKRSVFSAK